MPLDIGVGILSSIFLSRLFGIALNSFVMWAGILFALSPDIDFLFALRKNKRNLHKHRDLLHYPLIFVPTGFILVALFLDYRFAILFTVVTLIHFLHDSIGMGWGVRWLYPFSRNYYAFFYQYDLRKQGLPRKILYSWTPGEAGQLAEKYGDKNWIKNIYFKLHPYAVVEFVVFVAALILLLVSKYWINVN